MTDASTSLDMSTGLRRVAVRAKREPASRFHSLAHLIGVRDEHRAAFNRVVQENLSLIFPSDKAATGQIVVGRLPGCAAMRRWGWTASRRSNTDRTCRASCGTCTGG